MKHKHADLIKQWADGAKIQYYSNMQAEWVDTYSPNWDESSEYRIKPEEKKPVVRWLWATCNADPKCWVAVYRFMTEAEADLALSGYTKTKIEWSRQEFSE